MNRRESVYFVLTVALILGVGMLQSWNVALAIVNFALISAIMALGLNIQWGYGGLFNAGVMGFTAVGGLAAVLISMPPVVDAWNAGGSGVIFAITLILLAGTMANLVWRRFPHSAGRTIAISIVLVIGFVLYRRLFDSSVQAIEGVDPSISGYLGGLGLPILLSWPVGGLLAAGVAVIIGKIALGLRSDYLAIATLAIAEVVVAVLKHEDWLSRGVKNVVGLPRPVPFEVNLQKSARFQEFAYAVGVDLVEASSIVVKLCYTGLLVCVLAMLFVLCETALNSPWGRMMRAIRDNERAAAAMGKNIKARHLQIFVLGSAVCGIAGAIVTTLDGQFTPGSYQPLRFTFLIWIMVILGGSGNNFGAILGGVVVWFFWIQVEPMSLAIADLLASQLDEHSPLRIHLNSSAAHLRFLLMGIFLLLVMRFRPKGLIPER